MNRKEVDEFLERHEFMDANIIKEQIGVIGSIYPFLERIIEKAREEGRMEERIASLGNTITR